ncbi:hypothetical protein ANO11243_045660 [Dothideomycetidae sp. 11243]|nr:hypothetical protein ANO11243_045660 [fungal sp. No.11243]
MDSLSEVESQISQINDQIATTEQQLAALRQQLHQAHQRAHAARDLDRAYRGGMPDEWQRETLPDRPSTDVKQWPLSPDEYRRYGRQLIMSEVGLEGQLKLKSSRVLVVGAGGLGCPAATYLAGAGVGTLGLIDGDTVESSNLHRQIAHATSRVGMTKVSSAISYLRDLNPNVHYVAHETHLFPSSALAIFEQYDLVLDCTDHPTSRYLISDACILTGKPLVSASALRTEGQLIVLNYPPRPPGDTTGGPCYRCIFSVPPPPETLTSCSEGGILGPIVGTMGVLQSLEAIKLLTRPPPEVAPQPTLLLFAPYSSGQPFRSIRMRPRRPNCASCASAPTVTAQSLSSGATDYIAFCGSVPSDPLPHDRRIAPEHLASALRKKAAPVAVLDVRPATEHAICALGGSINIPFTELGAVLARVQGGDPDRPAWLDADDLVVVCRLGNDSQRAVRAIDDAGVALGRVVDVRDGFRGWRTSVDTSWPDY